MQSVDDHGDNREDTGSAEPSGLTDAITELLNNPRRETAEPDPTEGERESVDDNPGGNGGNSGEPGTGDFPPTFLPVFSGASSQRNPVSSLSSVSSQTKLATEADRDAVFAAIKAAIQPQPPGAEPGTLYGPAGEFAHRAAPRTEADPMAVYVTVLALAGAAMDRGPHVLAGNTPIRTNLFALILGESAKARKGTSLAVGQRLMDVADPGFGEQIRRGLGSGEVLIDLVRDATGDDDTDAPTDKRCLVQDSEYTRTLKTAARDSSILGQMLRDAADGAPIENHTVTRGSKRASRAHVGMLAHAVVRDYRAHLGETDVHGGTLNRYLHVCARRTQLRPDGGNVPEQLYTDYGHAIGEAIRAARATGRMVRSEEAGRRWDEVYREIADDNPHHRMLAHVVARGDTQCLRLSLLLALLDQAPAIEVAHVEAAYKLWRFCRASAAFAFADPVFDPVGMRVLPALVDAPDFALSRQKLRDTFGRNYSARDLDQGIAPLIERGLVQRIERRGTGGRPASEVQLTPWLVRQACRPDPNEGEGEVRGLNPASGEGGRVTNTPEETEESACHTHEGAQWGAQRSVPPEETEERGKSGVTCENVPLKTGRKVGGNGPTPVTAAELDGVAARHRLTMTGSTLAAELAGLGTTPVVRHALADRIGRRLDETTAVDRYVRSTKRAKRDDVGAVAEGRKLAGSDAVYALWKAGHLVEAEPMEGRDAIQPRPGLVVNTAPADHGDDSDPASVEPPSRPASAVEGEAMIRAAFDLPVRGE